MKYDYVIPDTNLNADTNDQAGQDAFNEAKTNAAATRNDLYSNLQSTDWGAYKASSGLELPDGNVDNFNLRQPEAYCSEHGAVVRKCNEADLNCNSDTGYCPCAKTTGSITKCSKYRAWYIYFSIL